MKAASRIVRESLLEKVLALVASGKDRSSSLAALLCAEFSAETAAFFVVPQGSDPQWISGHEDANLIAAVNASVPQATKSNLVSHLSFELQTDAPTFAILALRFAGVEALEDFVDLRDMLIPYCSIALQHDILESEVREAREYSSRHFSELSKIHKLAQEIESVPTDEYLDVVAAKTLEIMNSDAALLMVLADDEVSTFAAASAGRQTDIDHFQEILKSTNLIKRIVSSPEPLLVSHIPPLNEGTPGTDRSASRGSMTLAPIYDERGKIQGIIGTYRSCDKRHFVDYELKILDLFISRATLGINNRMLYARLNTKLQEISTLSSLTEALISTRDMDTLLDEVADSIANVVQFECCKIYITDPDTGRLSAQVVRGFDNDTTSQQELGIGIGEGVVGQVALSMQPMHVKSLSGQSQVVCRYAEQLNMPSFYAQPIIARARCIGVVVISDRSVMRSMTDSRIELLATFAHQAAIAIENAQIYKTQEKRYAELTTLYEISRRLASTSGVKRAAQTVTELAVSVTNSNSAILLLFNSARDSLRPLHWQGLSVDTAALLSDLPRMVHSEARSRRHPRVLKAGSTDELFSGEWMRFYNSLIESHQSVALVPLLVDDLPIGYLILGKPDADFDAEQLKLIAIASSQAAVALQSAWNFERRIGLHELELTAVYELMQKVRSAKSHDEALKNILDLVHALVPSDDSILLTLDDPASTLTIRAAHGQRVAHLVGATGIATEGIMARALKERSGLISSDPLSDAANILSQQPESGQGLVRSLVAVPLLEGEEVVGVLLLESDIPDRFSEESVRVLHLIASQAATIYREISSLKALTQYTDNVLRSIAAGVITANKDGQIATWNPRAEEILGLSPEAFIGHAYPDVFHGIKMDSQTRDDTLNMLDLTAQTGKVFSRNNLRFQTHIGEDCCINLTSTQLKSEAGEYLGIVLVIEDTTRAVQMKEDVERVRRLAETGQLAANIAHELRNPLSSIKGAAQLLRNELPSDFVDQHGEFLDIIVDEVNGLNRITTEFLEFSRVTPPDMKLHDINQLIARLLQFMGAYLTEQSVMACLDFDESLPPVYIDKPQIEQVIKNVVINAVQAMPHGGALTIKTTYNRSQDQAEMTFSDSGIGIAADKLEKIWAPFFTTKTKGTGLGLPIARKIVETHGGALSVRSQSGEGASFTLTVPVHPIFASIVTQGAAEIAEQRSQSPGSRFHVQNGRQDFN